MEAKKNFYLSLVTFLMSIVLLVGGVFAWFTVAKANANANARTIDDYGLHPGIETEVSKDGVNYLKLENIDTETGLILYPNQSIYYRFKIENKDNTDMKINIKHKDITIRYLHELDPLRQYTGTDKYSPTYYETHDYYYGKSNKKIDEDIINKDYFKNFIHPVTEAIEFWNYDVVNAPKKNLKDYLTSSALELIVTASTIETIINIQYYFNPNIYSSYFDTTLNKSIELRNSNPYLFQQLIMQFDISFSPI